MLTQIIHYTKVPERLYKLLPQVIAAQLLDITIVADLDKEHPWILDWNTENYEGGEGRSAAKLWGERLAIAKYEFSEFRPLRLAELSLIYKHKLAWENLAYSCNAYSLILEDDAIIQPALTEFLSNPAIFSDSSWDIVYLGGEFPNRFSRAELYDGKVILQNAPSSNCTDGYLIRTDAAQRLLDHIAKTDYQWVLPLDFELSFLAETLGLNVGHVPTPCILQDKSLPSTVQ